MPLSRLPLPSFSLVLTCDPPDGSGPPVEVLVMKDWAHASRREVHLNLQPKDDDPLMKTVDTRFAGSVAYDVVYSVSSSLAHWKIIADRGNSNMERAGARTTNKMLLLLPLLRLPQCPPPTSTTIVMTPPSNWIRSSRMARVSLGYTNSARLAYQLTSGQDPLHHSLAATSPGKRSRYAQLGGQM